MKGRSLRLVLGALAALFFVGACGLVEGCQAPQPTPARPPELTSTHTAVPTATITATATVTALPSFTPTAPVVATPTAPPVPTSTSRQPTHTPRPTPVLPTSTPVSTPVPTVVISDWMGEYFANLSLEGPAQVVRNDRVVDFALAPGTAAATYMPSENWSARWSRTWHFDEGSYRFHVLVDDGARLWVNNDLLIDAWSDGPERELTGDLYLRGNAALRLEYYNHLGPARIRLNWERVTQYPGWLGSYFPVPDLSALPVFQRGDQAIQFDWGTGSPRRDIPADNFSVRWTRRVTFSPSGSYRFRVISDDGVRLWVDDNLIIDSWRDGVWTLEKVITLTAGDHDVRLDYYEHLGGARVQLAWESVSATPTATGSATSTPTPTHTASPTPTSSSTPTSTSTSVPAAETASPIPSDTPTATATETPTPVETETPVPTPSNTVPAPTDTAIPPTETAVPVQPLIRLDPKSGQIGTPFNVVGNDWPPDLPVNLLLVRPVPDPGPGEPVGQVNSDGAGRFRVQLMIPPDMGWEGLPSATVRAESEDGRYWAEATYRILPELSKIPSYAIPADQKRFALPEATYLVLDSASAWAQQFGEEPPPAEPPVDWEREIVFGAFLGPQDPDLQVEVTSVVQRDDTVSVWLSAVVPAESAPSVGSPNIPRTVARVLRSALRTEHQQPPTVLVFAFLDASGRVLGRGPAGDVKPVPVATVSQVRSAQALPEVGASAAPEATVPVGAGAPTEAAGVQKAVEATPTVETVLPEAQATPAPAAQTATQAQASGVWWAVGGAALLLAGWGIGVAVSRRMRRGP